MKNYTKEQIERINEVFDSINGEEEGLTKEEIIAMYGSDNVEFIESEEDSASELQEEISIEDKIEELCQYYDCAGFGIKTEQDLFRLLGI